MKGELVPFSELDVERCVTSGQVFRFHREGEHWVGADAGNVISARKQRNGWLLASSPDIQAYARLFRLDADLKQIRRAIKNIEPRLARAVDAHPGLRTLRPQSAEETLFTFLCTPNNNVRRITTMVNSLASFGEPLPNGFSRFPSAKVIAKVPEAALRQMGFGYRAKTINLAAQLLSNRFPLQSLARKPYLEARGRLCEVPGVGLKVADCICLFGLGFDEAAPLDVHVYRAACRLFAPELAERPLSPSTYRFLSEIFRARFGRLAGWAQQYVFFCGLSKQSLIS